MNYSVCESVRYLQCETESSERREVPELKTREK